MGPLSSEPTISAAPLAASPISTERQEDMMNTTLRKMAAESEQEQFNAARNIMHTGLTIMLHPIVGRQERIRAVGPRRITADDHVLESLYIYS